MSEEQRKQSFEFYHVLAAARDFYANYDGERDFEQGQNVVDFAAAFASQVCEQRDETIRLMNLGWKAMKERAEAAELALQTLKEDVAKADKAAVKAMKLVVVQARQQAVAECVEICEKEVRFYSPRTPAYSACQTIQEKIRSLTPPPALTKEK